MIDPVTMSRVQEAMKKANYSASLLFPNMRSALSALRLVRKVQTTLAISSAEAATVIFKIAAKEFDFKFPED